MKKNENEASSKKELSLYEQMANTIILDAERVAEEDIKLFEAAINRRDEILVLCADYRKKLDDKRISLSDEKSITAGTNVKIKDSMEARRGLEREISELEATICDLESKFLPTAESAIKDAQEKVYAGLFGIIIREKNICQTRLDGLFAEAADIISSFQEAVLQVSKTPAFNSTLLREALSWLTGLDTEKAPQSAVAFGVQAILRAEIMKKRL